MTDTLDPFHTLDHHGNEYVIAHGNVPTDAPTEVTLWPLAMWRDKRDSVRPLPCSHAVTGAPTLIGHDAYGRS